MKKRAGFTVIEIIFVMAALGVLTALIAQQSGFLTGIVDVVRGSSSREKALAASAALSQLGVDVDEDGYLELPEPDGTDGLPAGVPAVADEYGTAFRYCGFDLGAQNSVDSDYVSNAAGYDATHPAAMVISAGKDKTFQTACTDTEAQGDDALNALYEADLRYALGGIGGMKDAEGEVALVTQTDNVNLSKSLVTPGRYDALPATDPAGGAIKAGTIASMNGDDSLYLHNGAEWKKVGGGGYYYTTSTLSVNNPQTLTCQADEFRIDYGTFRIGCIATGGFTGCIYYDFAVCSQEQEPEYYTIEYVTNSTDMNTRNCIAGYSLVRVQVHSLGYMVSDCYVHVAQFLNRILCKKD